MVHDPETTLNAYRELYPYTVEAVEAAIEDIKLSINNSEDDDIKKLFLERIKVLEDSLFIIYNDD